MAATPSIAIIDSKAVGKASAIFSHVDSDVPIVATLDEAITMGAEVLVLGTDPVGRQGSGRMDSMLRKAVDAGLSIVNGMHDHSMLSSARTSSPASGSGISARRLATCRRSPPRAPRSWTTGAC